MGDSVFPGATGEVSALRLGILARLADAVAVAGSPDQVALRSAAVLRQNDTDSPAIWLLAVGDPGYEGPPTVAADGPVVERGTALSASAHALAVAAVRSDQPQWQRLPDGSTLAELHARPVVEPGQDAPSLVLVAGTPDPRGNDAGFADYLELAALLIGAGVSGWGDLAMERQHTETLRKLDAAKSAFLANVSHELRTPLSLISGPLQDVLAHPDLPAELRERLQMVRGNVVRLTRMVDAMLDFSRMEAGRVVPALAELDVAMLLRALGESFRTAIENAGLTFVVAGPDLSRAGLLDRDMVERIVLNLLSNALKYTPRGRIELRWRDLGDSFEVAVADTGIGIAVRDQSRVFERFEQLPGRAQARSSEGAGIGLAMVKQLSELLGGGVDLSSSPGRGSTFTVRLPYQPPPAPRLEGARSITPRGAEAFLAEVASWEPSEAAGRPAALERQPAGTGKPRLLVAEDSADMRRYLAQSLAGDYDVELAPDGVQALAAARARRPDLLLSDVMMPGLDGFALVAEIRADPALRDLPVLLLSARAEGTAATTGLERGADDYVFKPFELSDLRARLASNLRRATSRSLDAAWRRAVIRSLQEAVIISEQDGRVTELNDAFSRLVGWTLGDGPFYPPYPWWPDPETDPEAFEGISKAHHSISGDHLMTGEYQLRRRDGQTVWASYQGAAVHIPGEDRVVILKSLHDVTRERRARERRQAAAQVSAEFAAADDLAQVVAIAINGLRTLFDGDSTVQVAGPRGSQTFTATGPVAPHQVPENIAVRLAGEQVADDPDPTRQPVEGILLQAARDNRGARAWVQFGTPRLVSSDEQIAADLIAQAFALAVDRVVAMGELADRKAHLERAIQSHRLVGQAVGILVERHRLTPGDAFQRLQRASQDRNVKLRELAQRVIESGLDPKDA